MSTSLPAGSRRQNTHCLLITYLSTNSTGVVLGGKVCVAKYRRFHAGKPDEQRRTPISIMAERLQETQEDPSVFIVLH